MAGISAGPSGEPLVPGLARFGRSSRTGLSVGLIVRRSPGPTIAIAILVIWVLVAIFGPIFFQHEAQSQDLTQRLMPPFHLGQGFVKILGTDTLGRSILAQLIVGARTALLVAGCAVLIASVIGTTIGMISGYLGRTWVDMVIMRFADMLMACPSVLLGLTIIYILSPGVWSLVAVLVITRLSVYMRLARAEVLDLRERTFVEVARGLGSQGRRIVFSDMRPLVVPTIGTLAMLELCTTMLNAAGLSFLGVGLQPPTVDWGLMVSNGQDYLQTAWWISLFPGAAIMLVTFSANVVSNWLRSMADPAEMARVLAARRWRRPRPGRTQALGAAPETKR